MTTTTTKQRVAIAPAEADPLAVTLSSPLTEMRVMQFGVESAREMVEQMQVVKLVSAEDAQALMEWVGNPQALDWDALERSDDGWGG
jgi:hypothetical protein